MKRYCLMVETEREIMDTVRSRQKKWLGCESWSKKLESLGYPTVVLTVIIGFDASPQFTCV